MSKSEKEKDAFDKAVDELCSATKKVLSEIMQNANTVMLDDDDKRIIINGLWHAAGVSVYTALSDGGILEYEGAGATFGVAMMRGWGWTADTVIDRILLEAGEEINSNDKRLKEKRIMIKQLIRPVLWGYYYDFAQLKEIDKDELEKLYEQSKDGMLGMLPIPTDYADKKEEIESNE